MSCLSDQPVEGDSFAAAFFASVAPIEDAVAYEAPLKNNAAIKATLKIMPPVYPPPTPSASKSILKKVP